ncbi:ABC transporter ATP-binding protein [[Mycobacterium] fortunisiensis]|uniref:ABC transporter ATP-binding protein n=1 Tax=[Mycobacterium] fortunisiensis TaxID=2600579 RepID=UPI001C25C337|nr:ATP-binding cassette domain-containing protein [[Mycobacterium] fortunisiensis]
MTEQQALVVRDLRVTVGPHRLVEAVDLDVPAGTITTLVGPSGAGKSTIAAAIAGTSPPTHRVDGFIACPGTIGYLPQDAAATLNPARRIGSALGELAVLHGDPPALGSGRARWKRERVAELLRQAAFPAGLACHRRYPFEFSGGQRVRLALAAVLAVEPQVLVLDEPTAGLDPASRDALVAVLDELRRRGRTILLVTHDDAVATDLSDRVVGVHEGRLRATGAAPAPPRPLAEKGRHGDLLLEVRGVAVRRDGSDLLRDTTFHARAGELIAVVGASGAGKTTLTRAIAGLERPTSGAVVVDGEHYPPLRSRSCRQLAAVQYVWQETRETFDRTRPVLDQVARTAVRLRGLPRHQARSEARTELRSLGLTAEQALRVPDDLSGGQLRRAALARALLAHPTVLLCDEPTTGLDPGTAERILERLDTHRRTHRAAVLLCTHDLPAVAARADRVFTIENPPPTVG